MNGRFHTINGRMTPFLIHATFLHLCLSRPFFSSEKSSQPKRTVWRSLFNPYSPPESTHHDSYPFSHDVTDFFYPEAGYCLWIFGCYVSPCRSSITPRPPSFQRLIGSTAVGVTSTLGFNSAWDDRPWGRDKPYRAAFVESSLRPLPPPSKPERLRKQWKKALP
jgi:hypothetical protein